MGAIGRYRERIAPMGRSCGRNFPGAWWSETGA
jgi:hypothetical protein